jgi:hypothetical protein
MEIIYHILAILGGAGAIVFGLSKFLGKVWANRLKERDRRESEAKLERLRQTFSVQRIQADRFAGSQYDYYVQLWDSLQALRIAVEALWQNATKSNIGTLGRQLRATRTKIDQWSIFFEEAHLVETMDLLEILEQFQIGKIALIEIRSASDLVRFPDPFVASQAQEQIDQNGGYRERFQQQLESIRISFQNRLSRMEQFQET